EEQQRLLFERRSQVVVEFWKGVDVRRHSTQAADLQPLLAEVWDERGRSAIREHAPDLMLEHRPVAKTAALCYCEQLFIRNAAPQEEGQPRRKLQVRQPIGCSGRDTGWVPLDPEQEL